MRIDCSQNEQIKKLDYFLASYTSDNRLRYHDSKAKESDLIWNSSFFFANVLYNSTAQKESFTLLEFEDFVANLEKSSGLSFDTNSLFEKYWLRNVLGKIKIPGTIAGACHRFKELKNLKNELIFICSLYEQIPKEKFKGVEITKTNFEKELDKYEQENNIKLKRNKFNNQLGLSFEKDDIISFSSIDIYYKPFIDFWNDFYLVNSLKEFYDKKDGGNLIAKKDVADLHKQHSCLYKKTPSIKELVSQKVFIEENETHYILNRRDTVVNYLGELQDRVYGYLWELIFDNYKECTDALHNFLDKINNYGICPNALAYTTEKSRNSFINAAYDIVSNELDLKGIENEFAKICIDSRFSRDISSVLYYERVKNSYKLNNSDHFELYQSFDLWNERTQDNILYEQETRSEISYLIQLIVRFDKKILREETEDIDNPKLYYFKNIFLLLDSSINKPSILWNIKHYMVMYRRELLPYLLCDEKYIPIAFRFIDAIEFIDKENGNLRLLLWVKSLELALYTLRSRIKDELELSAKIIFQLFRQINQGKYEIPYNRKINKKEKELNEEKKERELLLLSIIENSALSNSRNNLEFLIPEIFNSLSKQFCEYMPEKIYDNGTIQFPLIKWDGMIWLMKCSTYWKYKPQFQKQKADTHLLTTHFFKHYTELIEINKIETFNVIENKKEVRIPTWSEKIESLESLDWIYPVYFFQKHSLFNSFLEPRLFFEKTETRYNKNNDFIVSKLRTHIAVLLQVFTKLIQSNSPYGFDTSTLLFIKESVEKKVIDYISTHIEDQPEEGKVDLFSYDADRSFKTSEKEILLPQIARVINWFNRKEEIVDAFIRTGDINKILILADAITSEGIKKKLIESITKDNLIAFLKESSWLPEMQYTLQKMSQYQQLIEETKSAIKFWEENIKGRQGHKEYEDNIFRTKLLLAFFNDSIKELNTVELPKNTGAISISEPKNNDYRTFYIALIQIKDNPESSHHLFNELSNNYPQYPVFAMNRMAAKMNLAEQKQDINLYREALSEWEQYEEMNREAVDYETLGTTFFANKMGIHFFLSASSPTELEKLDKIFSKLDLPDKMSPNILEIKVNSLVERNRIEEAKMLLEEARRYHKFSGDDDIKFIRILEEKISGTDNIEELRYCFNRVITKIPKKLTQIIPENINDRIDIYEFITKEVARASNKMLDKINSVQIYENGKKKYDEDKINDVIQILVESRLSTWGWIVKEQARKGHSANNETNSLGEIDFDFQDRNQDSIITCEALILRKEDDLQTHIKKLIANYTNKRSAFIVLVYFIGANKNFSKKWKEYSESIVPKLIYPIGYGITSNKVDDCSEAFGFSNSAIKVGCSEHESDSKLYHVFVNLNYQINK